MRTSIVVIGLLAGSAAYAQEGFKVDREKREVLIPCKIAPRKLPNLPEVYPIEVIATYAAPKGLKAHETVVNVAARPQDVHKALESLGLKAGKPARGDDAVATGAELELLLEIPEKGQAAKSKRIRLESALLDRRTGRPLPPLSWHFTGSAMKQPDPAKPDQVYAADLSGTLIGIFPVTDELIIQTNLTMKEEGLLKLETNKELLPAEGTDAVLILRPATPGGAPSAARLSPRAAAEAAVLNVTHQMALAPAKSARADAPLAAPATADAPAARRRSPVEPARPAEALPLPASLPPTPKDLAPTK